VVHKSSSGLINRLAEAAARFDVRVVKAEWASMARRRIAVAIQRANAMGISAAMRSFGSAG